MSTFRAHASEAFAQPAKPRLPHGEAVLHVEAERVERWPAARNLSPRAVLFLVLTLSAGLSATAASREPDDEDAAVVPTPAVAVEAVPTDPPAQAAAPDSADAPEPPNPTELNRELRTVEEQVTNLKERVFRSKATLKLLKELVLDPSISRSRLMVWHENRLGGTYELVSAEYFLDGRSIYRRIDPTGGLDASREIKVLEQTLAPGRHTLQVNLVLRGDGFNLFSYLRDYQFNVSSSYAFDVEEGRTSVLRVSAGSRGALRRFEERPTVRYDERIEHNSEE